MYKRRILNQRALAGCAGRENDSEYRQGTEYKPYLSTKPTTLDEGGSAEGETTAMTFGLRVTKEQNMFRVSLKYKIVRRLMDSWCPLQHTLSLKDTTTMNQQPLVTWLWRMWTHQYLGNYWTIRPEAIPSRAHPDIDRQLGSWDLRGKPDGM